MPRFGNWQYMWAMTAEEEYQTEIEARNFTRAATIAEEGDLDDDLIEGAREEAFMQALGEWFNFRSADALAREWGFDRQRVTELCDRVVGNFNAREEHEGREFKVFDINRMDHTTAIVLVTQFRDRFR